MSEREIAWASVFHFPFETVAYILYIQYYMYTYPSLLQWCLAVSLLVIFWAARWIPCRFNIYTGYRANEKRQLPFVCCKRKNGNGKPPFVYCKRKWKFVFLGRQTKNSNRGLFFQPLCPSMSKSLSVNPDVFEQIFLIYHVFKFPPVSPDGL
jgi:hypothetical protein